MTKTWDVPFFRNFGKKGSSPTSEKIAQKSTRQDEPFFPKFWKKKVRPGQVHFLPQVACEIMKKLLSWLQKRLFLSGCSHAGNLKNDKGVEKRLLYNSVGQILEFRFQTLISTVLVQMQIQKLKVFEKSSTQSWSFSVSIIVF